MYGLINKNLLKPTFLDNCPSCGGQQLVEADILPKYAHVFYNPLFANSTAAKDACGRCEQISRIKEVHAALKTPSKSLIIPQRKPAQVASVVAIVAIVMTVAFFSSKGNNDKKAKLTVRSETRNAFKAVIKAHSATLVS